MIDVSIQQYSNQILSPDALIKLVGKAWDEGYIGEATGPPVSEEIMQTLCLRFAFDKAIVDIYDLTWSSMFEASMLDHFELYCKGRYCFAGMFKGKLPTKIDPDVDTVLGGVFGGDVNPIVIWGSMAQDSLREVLCQRKPGNAVARNLLLGIQVAEEVLKSVAARKPEAFQKCFELYLYAIGVLPVPPSISK